MSILTSIASAGASGIIKNLGPKAYNILAKDRNVLIPLDDIKNTKVLTDQELKKHICPKPQAKPRKRTPPKSRGRVSRLERILERLDR